MKRYSLANALAEATTPVPRPCSRDRSVSPAAPPRKKKLHLPKHTPPVATSSANDREISPDEALAAAFSMDPVVGGFTGLVIFYFTPNKILIEMNGFV